MPDFASTIAQGSGNLLPEKKQKHAGKPVKGKIEQEHKHFLATLTQLLDSGDIDPYNPTSFLKREVYDTLDEKWQDTVDVSLHNIADQIRMIQETRLSAKGENAIQLQTMVEHLWQMKQQIEEHHDAFKF
ncbi:MAG: hypothetical protein WCX29_03205 [Candidatus Peribacteraceae bacterium]|nr:hypothetical protein [Candidatus Peribacteria bacterium]